MKLTKIFGFVVLIHLGLVGVVLIQPGCQTSPQRPPTPTDTVASRSTTRMAPASASAPTRPGSGTQTSTASRAGGQVDSAFNSGVTGTQSGRSPGSSTRGTGSTTASSGSEGRLLPVVDFETEAPGVDSGATGSTDYSVRQGDTLSAIARRQGLSLNELLEANNLSKDTTIYVGQVLSIPGSGSASRTTAPSSSSARSGGSYTVKAGDNLTRIAKQHDVSVSELRRLNNLTSDTIRVGQVLQVPQVGGGAPSVRSSTGSTTAPTPSAPVASRDGQKYTVKRGDTPSTIARSFGVEPNALMRANNISDPRRLFVGQELVIPGSGAPTATTASRPAPASPPPAASPAPRRTETVTPTPLREQPSTPAIIGPQEAPRRLTLDDLESMDDEDLRFVEVEEANGWEADSSDEAQD